MVSKKKKIIVLSVMMVLLVATGFLNLALNNNTPTQPTNSVVTSANFFTSYRAERQATRSQEVLYLDAIISSSTASEEAKKVAENKKVELVKLMEQELVLEGLIKSKGFDDSIVTMTTSNVNVIVKDANLEASEVAQIVQIVQDSTGKSIDNIKIIPVE